MQPTPHGRISTAVIPTKYFLKEPKHLTCIICCYFLSESNPWQSAPTLYPKSDLILSIVLDFLLWALQCNSYTNYWARSNCTGPEHSPPCGCPPFAHPATSSEIISPPAFLINQLSIPGFSCLFQDQKFNWTTSRSQETLYLQFWLCRKATNQDLQYRDIIALQGSQMWGIHIFRTPTFHIL